MRTREDIESYLMRSSLSYKNVHVEDGTEDGMWLVKDVHTEQALVVSVSGPLLLFRMKVMTLDDVKDKAGLFTQLLQYNASDMVHGSYGLSDGAVVLTAGLLLENLDYNEFQGTVDDVTLALNNHYQNLSGYRGDHAA